ncbi:SDR family oxidoreductase [Stieleria sp. JC731]|uniref:SDR family NAD(P)-dependent oxidoreductase n=1 Tax=Pirellulaceae TaxID=2691357 RepID=UPI001E30EC23|nr:SDR family oxidoreductase [Stieleria sp. JC731]MCC9599581.1 SDR family oxidoreductase [Stieleria sp. JC731]
MPQELHQPQPPVVLVTGASAGLGLVIAKTFASHGYRVAVAGRTADRLQEAAKLIAPNDLDQVLICVGDVTRSNDCAQFADDIKERWGHLDVLVNCVGASDRGLTMELTAERIHELIDANVVGTLICSQAMLPLLRDSHGSVINIGSLAGKVGARYLGGYNTTKHALSGLTQQMRLELREQGVHVGLVSPGPIRRPDAGQRYADRTGGSLPESAAAPGGGTNFKGLDPQRVADAVYQSVIKRRPDVVLPGYMRLLITLGNGLPRLGDWLLLKFTSSKSR